MRMLFSLTVFLTAVTATSGLAGNDSPKEEASLTWTGGHTTGKVTVVIDGYTHNSILTSGDSVPLGTQIILVCRVVGLPYGTPLSYTWTCPSGPCEVEGYYSRKVYKEHILAVNATSTRDGGTYTCQVTATGGQEATGSFTLNVTGGRVVHSDGRLIPYQFPITHPHQISYLTKEGLHDYRVTCNVSRPPPPRFYTPNGTLDTGEMTQENYSRSAILDVNLSTFQNRDMYCDDNDTNYFYLYLTSSHNIPAPGVNVPRVTSSQVDYDTTANDSATRVIAGYEVTRFGVTMIGQHVNTGRGSRVTISPAVPGAQYRITAWALGDGRRSATPTVVDATTGEADPSPPRNVTITRVFQDGVELNWLPPTEPNGEVHYVVEYKREDSGNWTSVNTTNDSTHYNLTGLHNGTNYTIKVLAVTSGRAPIIPTTTSNTAEPTPMVCSTGGAEGLPAVVLAGAVVAFLLLTLLIAGPTVGVMLWRIVNRRRTLQDTMWIDHTETNEEMSGNVQVSAADLSEQRVEEDEQHVQDMHYEVCDIMGRGCCAREESNGIGFEGDCYANVETAENIPSEEEVEDGVTKTCQHDDQPKCIANAVYEVVDVARATPTHGIYTEEQHYEYNSVFGQHWSDSLVGGMTKENSEIGQGCPSNNAKKMCPQTESFHPNAMSAVVDKRKIAMQEKAMVAFANATATQDVYTDEQHYECSSVFGQDWLGNMPTGTDEVEGSEVQQVFPKLSV